MDKSYLTWLHTQQWCKSNPGKTAGIMTREGMFSIVFKSHDEMPKERFADALFDEDHKYKELTNEQG